MRPRVLLVEGQDELRVLPELLELAGISWPKDNEPVCIKQLEGVENLLAAGVIEVELKATGLEALGILVDADGDPSARWKQVRGRLAPSYQNFPEQLERDGAVHVSNGTPRVGVWVMPDNVRAGMLETMLLGLRGDEDDELQGHVCEATGRARDFGARYRDAHRAKAELHTWLAWQDPPGLQMHMGVKAGLLKPASPLTDGFVRWFRKLFGI